MEFLGECKSIWLQLKTDKLDGEDTVDLMSSYKVPSFIPPYTLFVHSMAAEAYRETQQWLVHHSLHETLSPHKFEMKLYCSTLAARTFPEANWKGLDLSSKAMAHIFFIDDLLDDAEIHEQSWDLALSLALQIHLVLLSTVPDHDGSMWECWREFMARYGGHHSCANYSFQYSFQDQQLYQVNSTHNNPHSEEVSRIVCSFCELWGGILESTNGDCILRLAQNYHKYLMSTLTQIQSKRENIILSLEDYVMLRRDSIAVVLFLVMVDLTDDVHLPTEILHIPEMQRIFDIVSDVVAWHNDTHSFKKEYLANGDKHNLVFLISHYLQYSFQEAASIITKILYAQCKEMEHLAKIVTNMTPSNHQYALSRYLAACRHWISGTDDWHRKSLRYK